MSAWEPSTAAAIGPAGRRLSCSRHFFASAKAGRCLHTLLIHHLQVLPYARVVYRTLRTQQECQLFCNMLSCAIHSTADRASLGLAVNEFSGITARHCCNMSCKGALHVTHSKRPV